VEQPPVTPPAPVQVAAPEADPIQDHIDEDWKSWFNSRWRPAMAWQYLFVCLFDFVFGPIMNTVFAAVENKVLIPWDPLTLKGGGMYHLAMGAVIGVVAWSRGQEKLKVLDSIATQVNTPTTVK